MSSAAPSSPLERLTSNEPSLARDPEDKWEVQRELLLCPMRSGKKWVVSAGRENRVGKTKAVEVELTARREQDNVPARARKLKE